MGKAKNGIINIHMELGIKNTNIKSGSDLDSVSAIPQLILIDKSGVVIYNKEEEKDYNLERLSQLLIDVMK